MPTTKTIVHRRGKNRRTKTKSKSSSKSRTRTRTRTGGRTIRRPNKTKNNRTRRRYHPIRLNLTGGSCMGPAEMCNFYSHLKYAVSDSNDLLDGVPSEANPSPVVQSSLGKH